MSGDSSNEIDFEEIDGINSQVEVAIVGVLTIVGAAAGLAGNPSEPIVGLMVGAVFFGGLGWVFGTESGREWLKKKAAEAENSQTQVTNTSSSRKKWICPNCGWKNDKKFTYCTDCGTKIKKDSDGSD